MESCSACREPARVVVLTGYRGRLPDFRAYCLPCAEAAERKAEQDALRPRPTHMTSWCLLSAGCLIGASAALADNIAEVRHPGFASLQHAGMIIGALCLLFGAIVRVSLLSAFGALLVAMFFVFDMVFSSTRPGFGPKQALGTIAGLALILAGIWLRWSRSGRTAVPAPISMSGTN